MSRRAMTLVEMLVATTATLILMAAVAQAFAAFGSAISGSRGVLELDARMRSAAWRLRSDLNGATARPLPPLTPESSQGYFEIIEGSARDIDAADGSLVRAADHDDILLFTTQSTEPPFVGRRPGGSLESTIAEVAWFARPTPDTANPTTYTIYRRQLLVMGYVGSAPFYTGPASTNSITDPGSWDAYFRTCDISARRETSQLVPNTLADLSRRESRFLHDSSSFPHRFEAADGSNPPGLLLSGNRAGEDIVLTDVLAFDVRVFDPTAAVVLASGSTPLVPGDVGYTGNAVASGAYVDLSQTAIDNSRLGDITPRFSTAGQNVGGSQNLNRSLPTGTNYVTYDTWTLAYEANGRNEDDDWFDTNSNDVRDPGEDLVDEAFDGRDNDGNDLIDDSAEFETRPPYPYPLRGIEVRIRCYEPSSRQVRQVTIRHTFVSH
jgi:type II secretory pathway component PulJ